MPINLRSSENSGRQARAIATSTLWQIASQCVMAFLSILTVKFTAVGLSKELFGNYNSAYGYLQVFGILADFGLYAVAVREVARAKNRAEVLGALIILRFIILVLALALALALVWLLPQWRGTPLPLGVTIAALVPFFTLLAGILRTIFQVEYRMHYVFIAEVTQRMITAGLMGFFIFVGIRGSTNLQTYHLFLFVGGIGACVLFFLSFIYGNRLIRIIPHWNKALLLRLARNAAPFGLAYLCIALYRQLDITLIALLRPDFEVQNAYYGPIVRMMDMGFLIPTFLLNSALPLLADRNARGDDTRSMLGKTFLMMLILGSISALFAFFWARPLVELLTTSSYLSGPSHFGSDSALTLQALPMFLNGIILFSFYVLLTRHAWRRLVLILGIGAVLSLTLNFLWIPAYGFIGASVTSITVSVVLTSLLLPVSLMVLPMRLPVGAIVQWVMFSVLLGATLKITAPFLNTSMETAAGLILAALWIGALLVGTGLRKTLAYAR